MRTYLSTLIFLLISQVTIAQVDLAKYNNTTTNQEYIDLLSDDLKNLERFVNFFSKSSDQPRTPSEVAPLKVVFNQHDYDVNIDQIAQANIQFTDLINDDFISIKLIQDPSIYRSLDDIKAPIYLKKVYYHDGTTQNIETKTNINTHFTPELELTKAVDKIDIEIAFSTIKKIDSLVLPAKVNQKVTYRGVDIEVVEVSDKGILLKTSSDELELDEIQAILKDKKRVSSYSSQRSGMHPKEFNLFIKKSVDKIHDIIAYANANIEIEHSQFKSVVGAKLSDFETQLSTESNKSEGVSYHYYEFGKPIDKLVIYNNNETYERSIAKTLTNQESKSHYIGSKDGKTLIYNRDLKLVKEFSSKYFSINDYYFETDFQYFHLNDKLEMQPLSYYKVSNVLNNFVVIQEDDESPQELVDPANKKIMNVDSYEKDSDFNYALIASNNSYYLLNNKSLVPVKINNVDKVRTADKGYFVVMKDEKYGFMNTEGQIVVPIQYDEVQSFSSMTDLLPTDLLFAVKQKDKWGFVDINNKTVIPFIYSGIKGTFSYGIALVYLDDALGLINLKNEKKSKFIDRNYSSSSNFGKRMINLSDGTYNYKGEKENDN
ncbi:MAG: WG repeat-containing protein [Flavobacterium sp.]